MYIKCGIYYLHNVQLVLKQSVRWVGGLFDFQQGCLVSACRGTIAFPALGSLFVFDIMFLNHFPKGSGTNSALGSATLCLALFGTCAAKSSPDLTSHNSL
ncbi:hypothetical protein ILYODFUR_015362 [Ilyodon furcidens]|uniref:Uncharacterized protein n=1 Tax=Ilyodon furcidens TaxID=33524 RepID=A0ABV0U5N9_9TELE